MKIISLTSDFGVQSQGVGIMEGVIASISPKSKVIHLMHGLPSYNIIASARTVETVRYLPIGYHVCVCDPGVGSSRKSIALKTKRGDFLIGPDNGVLIPASRVLGGIISAHEITNKKYMNLPISPIFHGRDIFSPAAAHLANGVHLSELGPKLNINHLIVAPYMEATKEENKIFATVIAINKFGSLHLNILHEQWEEWHLGSLNVIKLMLSNKKSCIATVSEKFSDVKVGENLILKDDYGRIEVAINQSSFAEKYKTILGSIITLGIKK